MGKIISQSLSDIKDEKRLQRYEDLISKFEAIYNCKPAFICRAPGRVNLIGEHIDYCGYSVLPMAISQDISVAGRTQLEQTITLANTNDRYSTAKIELDNYHIGGSSLDWYDYFLCGHKGVCCEEKILDKVGINLLVDGVVPKAAGMSSSSALVCASGLVTAVANDVISDTDRFKLAEICTKAERYIGTQGGGMDQSISFLAEHGKAKIIGFNPLTVDDVPLPDSGVFVIAHSRVESEKAKTASFNVRVSECKLSSQVCMTQYLLKMFLAERNLNVFQSV